MTHGTLKPLLIPFVLMLVVTVAVAEEYCSPTGEINTTYTHEGNWFNFTLISETTCYTCVDNGAGYGDVECYACDTVPTVSFIPNQTCGVIPFAIRFTDTSGSSPTSWNWSFGDGDFSELQHPVHNYTSVGLFPVNLSATNVIGTGFLNGSVYISSLPVNGTCPSGVVGIFAPLQVQGANGIAWAAPFILSGVGFCIIVFGLRRRRKND